MNLANTPEPTPRPDRQADRQADQQADQPGQQLRRPAVTGPTGRPDLRCLPEDPDDNSGDLAVVAGHVERLQAILALAPGRDRAVAATRYLATLEECRRDVTAVRDVSVQAMHTAGGMGGVRIAAALGLNASRGQQLVYRAQSTHAEAAQHLARIRRRLVVNRGGDG